MKQYKLGLAIALSICLTACSSTQPLFILAPDVAGKLTPQYQQQPIKLEVQDLRRQQHLVQISKEQLFENNEKLELVGTNQLLQTVVGDTLGNLWQQQGLAVTTQQGQSIRVDINQALIEVAQSVVRYQAKTLLAVSVTLVRGDKTLNKKFDSQGQSEGPLTADMAVLERDFNQQLGQLLLGIVKDPELIAFIK